MNYTHSTTKTKQQRQQQQYVFALTNFVSSIQLQGYTMTLETVHVENAHKVAPTEKSP